MTQKTNRRNFTLSLLAAGLASHASHTVAQISSPQQAALEFNPEDFVRKSFTANGQTVWVRAYEGLPTVTRPSAPDYQALNLYIPEDYFQGKAIGPYNASSAPIFFPNQIGGYMPALPGKPDVAMGPPRAPGVSAPPTAMAVALTRGLLVASPGARGRSSKAANGSWTGKAPSAILDLKAAVRWLRFNANRMPGNVERIISNGTSAGGALSALLGASGNSPDYAAQLQAMGALPERDDIFAVSSYCPITNLEHADAAYEWQFRGQTEYRGIEISMLDFKVQRKEVLGHLNAEQQDLSRQLQAEFIGYVNSLKLRSPDGNLLQLQPDGQGSLQDHLKALLMQSAQKALQQGQTLAGRPWLTVESGRVTDMDFSAYAQAAGRMKGLPAFDGLALEAGENQLFGNASNDKRHFTDFSMRHSKAPGAQRAEAAVVQQMNAMHYARSTSSRVASHWRIRQGTLDRDTSLAIPVLLASELSNRGLDVDIALPWDQPHSGDYDLDELFGWIESKALLSPSLTNR